MANSHVGVIKSYGLKKGFGFITCEDFEGEEIFFSNRGLPREIVDSFSERSGIQLAGKTVTFSVMQNESGKLQAGEVCLVAAEGEDSVGRVKSYNPSKGYGFLTSASVQGDVFFTKKDLPTSCQDAQIKDLTARFKLVIAEDGKPQAKQVTVQGATSAVAALPWGGKGMNPMALLFGKGGGGGGWGGSWMGGGCGGGCFKGGGGCGAGGCGGKGGGGVWKQAAEKRDRALHGVVKNYDDGRGFGFINTPEVPVDVYFKGQGLSFSAGDRVSFYLNYTQDGKPQGRAVSLGFEDGESCQGTVKSYNSAKGFGFVQVPDRPGDVYFKKDCLPSHMQDQQLAGREASFLVHLAPDGKPQVQQMDIVDGHPPPRQGVKRAMEGGAYVAAKRTRTEASEGSELEGSVKSYNMTKGFGFIRTPHLPQDVYFKGQHPQATPNSRVRFVLAYTPDGKPQANGLEFFRH